MGQVGHGNKGSSLRKAEARDLRPCPHIALRNAALSPSPCGANRIHYEYVWADLGPFYIAACAHKCLPSPTTSRFCVRRRSLVHDAVTRPGDLDVPAPRDDLAGSGVVPVIGVHFRQLRTAAYESVDKQSDDYESARLQDKKSKVACVSGAG